MSLHPNKINAHLSGERVVDAATKLFSERGYAATTMRDIANACNVKAGSLYYHYASKEDILIAALEREWAELLAAVVPALERNERGLSHRERFRAALLEHLRVTTARGDYSVTSSRFFSELPSEQRRKFTDLRDALDERWRSLLLSAQISGEVRTTIDLGLVRMFVFGAANWTHDWFDGERKSLPAVVDIFTDLIFDGLAPSATDQA